MQEEYKREAGSVVEVDYYNAASLLGMTDEQLIQHTLHTYLAACHPAYGLCQVQDASVLRYKWVQRHLVHTLCAEISVDNCIECSWAPVCL